MAKSHAAANQGKRPTTEFFNLMTSSKFSLHSFEDKVLRISTTQFSGEPRPIHTIQHAECSDLTANEGPTSESAPQGVGSSATAPITSSRLPCGETL